MIEFTDKEKILIFDKINLVCEDCDLAFDSFIQYNGIQLFDYTILSFLRSENNGYDSVDQHTVEYAFINDNWLLMTIHNWALLANKKRIK